MEEFRKSMEKTLDQRCRSIEEQIQQQNLSIQQQHHNQSEFQKKIQLQLDQNSQQITQLLQLQQQQMFPRTNSEEVGERVTAETEFKRRGSTESDLQSLKQQPPGATSANSAEFERILTSDSGNFSRNLKCDHKLEFPNFEISTTIEHEMFDESPRKGKLEDVIESELKDKIGEKNDKFVYEVVGEVYEVHYIGLEVAWDTISHLVGIGDEIELEKLEHVLPLLQSGDIKEGSLRSSLESELSVELLENFILRVIETPHTSGVDVISYLCKGQKGKAAHVVYLCAKKQDTFPHRSSFIMLISSLCRENGNVHMALEVRVLIFDPGGCTFDSLLTVPQKVIVHKTIPRGIHFRGDGTQRGSTVMYKEIRRRGLKVAVAGISKNIDNGIPVINKSLGFDTAVEEAQRAINAALVEDGSTETGIGGVKFMGCYRDFIAMYATLASRVVDLGVISESPFYLEGEGVRIEYVEKRLKDDGLTRENVASHFQKYRLYWQGISLVASQQANMVAALGGKDASYLHVGALEEIGVSGLDAENVCYLHDLADATRLVNVMQSSAGGNSIVIGGGYIGMECAASLVVNKINATMVFPEAQCMDRLFTPKIASHYEDFYISKSFNYEGKAIGVNLRDGSHLPADKVVVGIGIHPNTSLFDGQLTLEKGGIKVNGHMQSSNSSVYAVGDVVCFSVQRFGEATWVMLSRPQHDGLSPGRFNLDVKIFDPGGTDFQILVVQYIQT